MAKFISRRNGVSRIIRNSYNEQDKSWWSILRDVEKRDGKRCSDCGTTDLKIERHHIVPLSRGGTNSLRNIISLCERCHARRHGHLFKRLV